MNAWQRFIASGFMQAVFANKQKITAGLTASLSMLAAANMLDPMLVVKITTLSGVAGIWFAVWHDIKAARIAAAEAVLAATREVEQRAADSAARLAEEQHQQMLRARQLPEG